MENKINKWNKLTNQITEDWIREVFKIDKEEDLDYYYVANDIGGVFNFADYWISFNDILTYYKLNVTKEQFISWYVERFCLFTNH